MKLIHASLVALLGLSGCDRAERRAVHRVPEPVVSFVGDGLHGVGDGAVYDIVPGPHVSLRLTTSIPFSGSRASVDVKRGALVAGDGSSHDLRWEGVRQFALGRSGKYCAVFHDGRAADLVGKSAVAVYECESGRLARTYFSTATPVAVLTTPQLSFMVVGAGTQPAMLAIDPERDQPLWNVAAPAPVIDAAQVGGRSIILTVDGLVREVDPASGTSVVVNAAQSPRTRVDAIGVDEAFDRLVIASSWRNERGEVLEASIVHYAPSSQRIVGAQPLVGSLASFAVTDVIGTKQGVLVAGRNRPATSSVKDSVMGPR